MPDIYEQLQTEADVEAEKIRPNKEAGSLYGAKWLTVEDLLTDDKGYPKFAVDSAKGGGGGTILPSLTVALTTNGEYSIGDEQVPIIDNNFITPGTVSVANTETIYNFLVMPQRDEQDEWIAGAPIKDVPGGIITSAWVTGTDIITTSNEVNCEVIEPEPGYKVVLITDVYTPASITINFSHND